MFNRKKVKKLECEIAALQGTVTALTNKIDSLLAAKVDKNDVINQINLSNEQIRISGNKIHITGETAMNSKLWLKVKKENSQPKELDSVSSVKRETWKKV